jgi:hypothetical protein
LLHIVGSVYIYSATGNAWSCQNKILASDGAASDQFGIAVSVYDNTALIGAYGDDDKGSHSGKFVYPTDFQ